MISTEESDRFFDSAFSQTPAMAILRGFRVQRTGELALSAWSQGINLVEVPLQGAESEAGLGVLAADRRGLLGAGTVTTREQVDLAVSLGAVFTVAPGFDEAIAGYSLKRGLPHLAGVATPTEIHRASSFGFGWLKAFPASELGPGWFRAMSGPFPQIKLVATGGISRDNFQEFLGAGAAAVSFGSSIESLPESPFRFASSPGSDQA